MVESNSSSLFDRKVGDIVMTTRYDLAPHSTWSLRIGRDRAAHTEVSWLDSVAAVDTLAELQREVISKFEEFISMCDAADNDSLRHEFAETAQHLESQQHVYNSIIELAVLKGEGLADPIQKISRAYTDTLNLLIDRVENANSASARAESIREALEWLYDAPAAFEIRLSPYLGRLPYDDNTGRFRGQEYRTETSSEEILTADSLYARHGL